MKRLGPTTRAASEAFPGLATSFSVLNEFFNELAFNPGPSKGGFLFFLDWGNHNLNSVLSSADAHGALGRSLVYFNCKVLELLKGVSEVNETVKGLVALLRPPTREECVHFGLGATGAAASVRRVASASQGTSLRTSPFATSPVTGALGGKR